MKNLKVYKSSAGSGKTFTLVLEYLALVLQDPINYRRILAVTFTNKAAFELKDRMLEALHAIATAKADDTITKVMLPFLASRTQLDETVLQERANWVFHHILHHYHEFAVSTIDAFVQKLARTFTRELSLPSRYEILLETEQLVNLTRDRIIASVGKDPFVSRLILDFIKKQLQEDENWRIESRLGKFVSQLLEEEAFLLGKANTLSDMESVRKATKIIRGTLKTILDQADLLVDKIEDLLAKNDISPDEMAKGSNGLPVVIKRVRGGDFSDAMKTAFFKQSPEAGKWAKGKLPKAKEATIQSIEPELIRAFDELKTFVEKFNSQLTLFSMLEKNLLSFALQQRITEEMELLRSETSEVHISEFNKRLSKTLYDASVPYIYERMGERFRHFMIDEFQDTSLLQWQNFLPLIANSLAAGNLSLLVGDAKQAIYRFRSGEVEQFIRLPETELPDNSLQANEMASILKQQYQDFSLDTNYRSLPEIVKFNNAFFKSVSSLLSAEYMQVYEQVEQKFISKSAAGFVQLELLNEADGQEDTDMQQLRVSALIVDLIDSGYSPGDIVILTRQNERGADMARFLTSQGYSVVSPDSLLVKNSDKVQLLTHALYFLLNPADAVIASGLRYYHALLNPLASKGKIDPTAYFSKEAMSHTQMEVFLGLPVGSLNPIQLNHYSIYDFCEHLLRHFKLNKNADAYLLFFLESVFRWQNQAKGGLGDFLQYWEDSKEKLAVKLPEDDRSIRVMSIHKAKGLEFPVVIYPYAASGFSRNNTKSHAWVDLEAYHIPGLNQAMISVNKSLEGTDFEALYVQERKKSELDSLNLMYVACTRAVEQLYTITSYKGDLEKTFQYHFLKEAGYWVDDQYCYSFGSREGLPLKSASKQDENEAAVQHITSRNWRDALEIARPASYGKATKAVQYGNKLHEVLARLRYADQLSGVLQWNVNQGFLDHSEAEKLGIIFEQIAKDEKLKKAFSPPAKIRNEAEILTHTGELLRPDRIAILPEKVMVIDYKTGEQSQSHLSQISAYKNALQELFIQPVEGHLVYLTESPMIISV
ncbi:MAG: UvrD-helicase domain-containing protein [Bacteroidales bacterium]|nr:UvrD-helicase domain-containing protein [Bacteroidales bacterium]